MMRVILRLLINAAALWTATRLVTGVSFTGDWRLLFAVALVFGVVNVLVRPVVKLLTFPLLIVTLGLFTFVGNYIMDAFTTEIGGEVYLKLNGLIAMGSLTAGELRGTVLTPDQRGPSLIGKLGFDRQVNNALRVRLTGSMYKADKAMSNTLYSGDRAGSRYYWVMENTTATETAQKDSGLINPGFKNKVTAFQMNPFVKFRGLEVFGVLEHAKGKASTEAADRTFRQHAVDIVYRFLPEEKLFVGGRFNKVTGELLGITGDVGAKRWQFAGGWFITPALLAKVEYVDQKYFGYPDVNKLNGGHFKGMIAEGVVAF